MINNPIIYKFFKDFTNHRKKTNRAVVFSCRPFPNILKYMDNWWNLPTIWKTRLLKSFISICKFGSFKNPFSMTTLNFTLAAEDLPFWYKWKNWFLWTMSAAQGAENHGYEWGLTWYFLWGIYTSFPTWTPSQNLLAAAKAPSLKLVSAIFHQVFISH